MKKVLIFGTVPPPIGGVTIHLERFLHFSQNHKEQIDVQIYDIKKQKMIQIEKKGKNSPTLLSSFLNADIIHIHLSNNIKIPIALLARVFFKKVIYTHHNSRVKSMFWFKIINFLSNIIILVNDKEIDTEQLNKKKIRHIPAFIPPYKLEALSKPLLEKIDNYSFVISTNCSRSTIVNGKELYGFDLVIEAYGELIQNKKLTNTLLILVDPSTTMRKTVDELLIAHPYLDETNLIYIDKELDFSSLIKKSHLTIRATRSDGDSISVRESLYFKTPIIASDVTYRPKGTILFKNDNAKDLENKILDIYTNSYNLKPEVVEDFGQQVVSLYLSKEY